MRRLAFNFSALKQAITMTFERLSVRAFLLADVGLTDVELTYVLGYSAFAFYLPPTDTLTS